MHNIDRIDVALLNALQADSSLPSSALAERVGISQPPCWRRVQRLKELGYIRGEVALLDRKKIGLNAQVFVQIKLSAQGRQQVTQFADAVRQFPEVLECYVLMGSVDFLLRVVAEDVEAYERFFFEHLSRIPGAQEINSIVALSEIKSTTALPLNGVLKDHSVSVTAKRRSERKNRTRPIARG